MKIFSDLIGRIFGKDEAKKTESPSTTSTKSSTSTSTSAPSKLEVKNTAAIDPDRAAEKAAAEARKSAQAQLVSQSSANQVDVVAILDARAKDRAKEGIDWRNSIVDLMKICGMDSSYENRAELAKELGYTGEISKSKSSAMNVWLHKEMLRQIVANGGKVPQNLLN